MLVPLFLAAGLAHAAETPRWTVQVDPLTAAIGLEHVQVERVLTPRVSLYAGPNVRLFDGILADINGPWRAVGLELGVRWYPLGEAPRGPWLLARGVAGHLWTVEGPEDVAPGHYESVLGGYTGILGGWFVLSGGLGAQHFAYQVGGYGPTGWSVAAHSAVGVAF